MSYSEQDGNVVLTMSREDYQMLMIVLGYATGGAIKDAWTPASRMFELTNRLNEGNPNYKPYQAEAMSEVGAFEVFARMAELDDKALKLAPLANILSVKTVKARTQVTIGVGGNILAGILNEEFCGGLLLCEKKRFDELKAEMEKS